MAKKVHNDIVLLMEEILASVHVVNIPLVTGYPPNVTPPQLRLWP